MKGAPQQGTPVGTTSSAHMAASCVKLSAMPIFLLLHGTCTATLFFTCQHSVSPREKGGLAGSHD